MIARTPEQPQAPQPAAPLRGGANVREVRNALGFCLTGPSGAGADFRHPFLVTVGGQGARVGRGLILGDIALEPMIGSARIGGEEGKPPPVLRLDKSLVNKAGESWVCVQAKPTAEGKLDPEGKDVKVLQSAYPYATEGEAGRAPLALLALRKGQWQVYQIAMFHLRYETAKPATGPRRHFFL